jgi:hypothetical protein
MLTDPRVSSTLTLFQSPTFAPIHATSRNTIDPAALCLLAQFRFLFIKQSYHKITFERAVFSWPDRSLETSFTFCSVG